MSFESPVPAQTEACRYLTETAMAENGMLVITGHSKGGNLAVYAGVHATLDIQCRLEGVWSFDGPGLDDASVATPGYRHVLNVMHSIMPQGSVVGLMMTYQEKHQLIQSNTFGILQHDPFSWQTEGLSFVPARDNTLPSKLTDRTLHTFLRECTPEQRSLCVDTIFDMLDATDCGTMSALKADRIGALVAILRQVRGVDSSTIHTVRDVVRTLVQSGADSALSLLQDSTLAERLEENIHRFSLLSRKQQEEKQSDDASKTAE